MKKVILLTIIACLGGLACCRAQQENIWAFGFNSGLNFNGALPVPFNTAIDANEASASVCDVNGQLLFYTNGTRLWDRNHNQMPNGFNLQTLYSANNSSSQGALIVPMPDSAHKYYVFSLTEYGFTNGSLFYSVVNMDLNGGMGDVEPGRKAIFVDSNLTEQMTAVKGDDCNIWLLTASRQDSLKAFNIDYSGIDLHPVVSPLLFSRGVYDGIIGCMDVSPDRQKLALARGRASLYHFDPQTGTCSNPVSLDTTYYFYSVCFSPDNSKLYAANENGGLYQFNTGLAAPAQIVGSRFQVSTAKFYGQKRGPDGKIYLVNLSAGNSNIVKTIHTPDLAGAACQLGNGPALLQGVRIGLPTVVPPALQRGHLSSHTVVPGGCTTINLTLQADAAGVHHLWNDNTTGSAHPVTAPGIYWVKYDKPCASHIDTFRVVYDFIPILFPELKITASCRNEIKGRAWIKRTAGDTTAYTCTWRNAQGITLSLSDTLQNVPSGNYTLQILSDKGCDTTITLFVPEEDSRVSFTADTLICLGDILHFSNTSDAYYRTFQWSLGDGGTSILSDPDHEYRASGSYRVVLRAQGAICSDTVAGIIVVDEPVAGSGFIKDKEQLCMGGAVTFTPSFSDSTTTGTHWSFGDASSFLQPASAPVQHAYDHEGLMNITMTTDFRACPSVSFTDSLQVYPFPLVRLGDDTAICYGGSPLYLANLAPYEQGDQYRWNTGDTALRLKVVHHGAYSLSVTSAQGCTTTEAITVKKDCYIDIPNAFTPNGDGHNDYFFPRQLLAQSLSRFQMKIFNRWGQVIFETSSIQGRGWDGKLNEVPQPEGVYLYLIEAEVNGRHTEKYQGNITLIR